jgi:hypothetical protein
MEGGGSYPALQKLEWISYGNLSRCLDILNLLTSIVVGIVNHVELSPRDRDISTEHIPKPIVV